MPTIAHASTRIVHGSPLEEGRFEIVPKTAPPNSLSVDEEMKKFEGTWAITEASEDGERATPEQKEKGLGRVVFKGNKMT
ncbi:MAG: hypothetical protein ACXVHC_07060, partial [Frankiaceae bacterium]